MARMQNDRPLADAIFGFGNANFPIFVVFAVVPYLNDRERVVRDEPKFPSGHSRL